LEQLKEREQQTRKQRIDPHLKAAGWPPVLPFTPSTPLESYGTSAIEEFGVIEQALIKYRETVSAATGIAQ
jgi:hypothetical protein